VFNPHRAVSPSDRLTDEEEPAPWAQPSVESTMQMWRSAYRTKSKRCSPTTLHREYRALPLCESTDKRPRLLPECPSSTRSEDRLSTAMNTGSSDGAEELPSHISLPLRCARTFKALLSQRAQVALLGTINAAWDHRWQFAFKGDSLPVQKEAAHLSETRHRCLCERPRAKNIGKTVLGRTLISQRACSTSSSCPKALPRHWKAQLAMFLDVRRERHCASSGSTQALTDG